VTNSCRRLFARSSKSPRANYSNRPRPAWAGGQPDIASHPSVEAVRVRVSFRARLGLGGTWR
jgi:hypothetical protein